MHLSFCMLGNKYRPNQIVYRVKLHSSLQCKNGEAYSTLVKHIFVDEKKNVRLKADILSIVDMRTTCVKRTRFTQYYYR